MADALCDCRFESTYTTTEETVYQNLLDVILNCIRCDAGVSLTKRRAWTIIETVYNMAFKWSVTPVRSFDTAHTQLLQKSAVNTLTHIILTLFSRLRHPEDFCCEPPPEKLVASPPSFLSASFRLSPSGASVAEAAAVAGAEAGNGAEEEVSVDASSESVNAGVSSNAMNAAADGVGNAGDAAKATDSTNTMNASDVVNASDANDANNTTNANNANNTTETETTGDLIEKETAEEASETEEESVGESDDALVPYDITLLQQLLGYLISLTDPSK